MTMLKTVIETKKYYEIREEDSDAKVRIPREFVNEIAIATGEEETEIATLIAIIQRKKRDNKHISKKDISEQRIKKACKSLMKTYSLDLLISIIEDMKPYEVIDVILSEIPANNSRLRRYL